MKKATRVQIVKRDGSVEEFQFAKLRRCLAAAMKACSYDIRYADALTRAVSMHLEEWTESKPPSSDYVFRCVKTVLDETGLGDVAGELSRHRRQRAVHRRRISILDDASADGRTVNWSKSAVATVLADRHQMAAGTARILASEIESRVFAVGYQLVTARLLDALIRNELLAWGFTAESKNKAAAPRAAPEKGSAIEKN